MWADSPQPAVSNVSALGASAGDSPEAVAAPAVSNERNSSNDAYEATNSADLQFERSIFRGTFLTLLLYSICDFWLIFCPRPK